MGIWGKDLFSNDFTLDVKDTYLELLNNGFNEEEAYGKTYSKFSEIFNSDEEPLFWYAIAYTQWSVGRLNQDVKNTALQFFRKEKEKACYSMCDETYSSWMENLQLIMNKISSPQCEKKVFPNDSYFKRNLWNVGDIYAYRLHSETAAKNHLNGKHILFQKIGDVAYYNNSLFSVIRILDSLFDDIPNQDHLNDIRTLPLILSPPFSGIPIKEYVPSLDFYFNAAMIYNKKNDYPEEYFTYICTTSIHVSSFKGNDVTSFILDKDCMEDWIVPFYLSWRGEYY